MGENSIAEHSVSKRPLDDLMLAMDVVDTLRHRASLVERELNDEERDQQLIDRLREIYAAQGIEVPDDVLAEGVEALKEDRFKYTPPQPGLSVTLARIYVNRNRWLLPMGILLGLIGAACLGYWLIVIAPKNRLLHALPQQIAVQQKAIADQARILDAKENAQQMAAAAQRALIDGDVKTAQNGLEQLKELRGHLEQEYELQIVTEGSTGVWRIPDVNQATRNCYIIVQPITASGQVLTMPITSEEDGRTSLVSKWGLRVDEETFQQIAEDKKDDGIIQQNRFGVKRAGYLEPEYLIPTTGGAITSW